MHHSRQCIFPAPVLACVCLLCLPSCRKDQEPPVDNTATNQPNNSALPDSIAADADGNLYRTIQVGGRRWFAENLRSVHYANGDLIPYVSPATDWTNSAEGAWSIYNSDFGNNVQFGLLYNGYAVLDPRNACPAGWHVPTDADWQDLEFALGMPEATLHSVGTRGAAANVGGHLKGLILWNSPNTGADDSIAFAGYAGGGRNTNGGFFAGGTQGNWWTSTLSDSVLLYQRRLFNTSSGIARFGAMQNFGLSVRCVED